MDGVDLSLLGDWLDQAGQERQLPDPWLSVAGDAANNRANSALYLRALSSRLASLGYLPPDQAKGDTLTSELSTAIRAFQKDAGFFGADVDGWAGPLTKRKLQQLVSFEEEQSPQDWGEMGQHPDAYPAVARAVYLRLYCLGFLPDQAPLGSASECRLAHNPALRDGLGRFLAAAQALGLAVDDPSPRLDTTMLGLLFGQDALIAALSRHPGFIDDPVNGIFVEAIARVELWLLGYDVDLGPSQSLRQRQSGTHGPHGVPHYIRVDPVTEALTDFEEKFPGARSPIAGSRFSTAFFSQLAALDADEDAASDPALQDIVLAQAAEHSDSLMEKLGQLASRIWDGAKRLWAWLKRAVATAWGKIESELWNLARFIARNARESYELVLKAVDIVHRATVYLRRQPFPGSDPQSAVLAYGADFDARLFINAAAPTGLASALVHRDARESRYFVAACRILGCLLAALAEVVRAVTMGAAFGWFLLLLALSRILAVLRNIRDTAVGLDNFATGDGTLYVNPVT